MRSIFQILNLVVDGQINTQQDAAQEPSEEKTDDESKADHQRPLSFG